MREKHKFASLGQAQGQISGRDRSERAAGPPPFTDALIFAHSQKLSMANRSSSCCGGSRKNREALRDMRPKLPKFKMNSETPRVLTGRPGRGGRKNRAHGAVGRGP